MKAYHQFIAKKFPKVPSCGFAADERLIPGKLFDWQQDIVRWATSRGRAAIFAACGLGKTAMQIAWAEQIVAHTNKPVIIMAPLAVSQQTVAEGEKFGISVQAIRGMESVTRPAIYIINYEMLGHVNPDLFGGVVLDESSILKALIGKTKMRLIEMFQCVPYRLCCTATPAPNDHAELGNHAEFLGIMRTPEMLSTWFVNDGFQAGHWRIKGHAADSFWQWVSSWAVSLNKPSDIGNYSDEGYILPELQTIRHEIQHDETDFENGMLIRIANSSASTIKKDMRRSLDLRVAEAAKICSGLNDDPCIVWCELNDESTALVRSISGAVEITGSMKPEDKEQRMIDFTTGKIKTLVTKPKIAGFGMNWQHCHNMIFVGCSYSFEARYQAIRRCWRFGQTQPVIDNVILAGQEAKIFDAVAEKERKYMEMEKSMSGTFGKYNDIANTAVAKEAYAGKEAVQTPDFLR